HADVTLVTFGPRFQRREHDGIRHVILRALAPSVENPVPLTSFFLRERFDLVHAFQLRAASTSWLTLWCRARRPPLVVTDVVVAGQVADARYLRDLEARAKGASVRFMISPSDDELLQEYGESAVTVSASVYRDMYGREWPQSELLGLTLLESMAVGTPVVCTRVGGMPEHVQDGVTGFIVPPNDPTTLRDRLRRLLDDPALARRMGEAGCRQMQAFGWPAVADAVFAQYASLHPAAG